MKKNYIKYGNFSSCGTEFRISNTNTPRPWVNYLSNGNYCLIISQKGGGYSFYLDSEQNRITRWAPGNYLKDQPGRFIYIRDKVSGKFWNAVRDGKTKCIHGLGYTVISSVKNGIETAVTFFVPQKDPVEVWSVEITNKSGRKRKIQIYSFLEWMPGNYFDDLEIRNINILMNRGEYDGKNQVIYAKRTPIRNKPWKYEAFLAVSKSVKSQDIDLERFLGREGSYKTPEAVVKGSCFNTSEVSGVNMAGVLQSESELSANGKTALSVIAGIDSKRNDSLKLIKKYRKRQNVMRELEKTKEFWRRKILNNIEVKTPDKDFDLAVNVWLKYQTYMNNHWGRSATYYHEGAGEFGYRNTAQDAWAMTAINPVYAKRRLIKLAEHQWKTGQPLPGWSLETGANTHNSPSDFPIWLPILLLAYIKETGETDILKKKVNYFDGESDTLYQHARKATLFLLNVAKSKRGLPLMGSQDWNDAFDRAGIEGKGESVWLAMGLCVALLNMSELAEAVKDKKMKDQCMNDYKKMKKRINRYAWDGNWYIYGFNDYGEPIGSSENSEDRIQINAQSWAIMAGLPGREKLQKILKAVDIMLETPYGPALFTPAYTKYNSRVGRISTFAPGTKENAAVFNHAGAFKIFADTIIGRSNKAYRTFRQLLPMCQDNIEVFKTEPYVLPEYVIGPGNPRFGEGAFTWLTGSSDWMFMAATQRMLGVRPQINGLEIDPCIPSDWKKCYIKRGFRGVIYNITINNPHKKEAGVRQILVNGEEIKGQIVPEQNTGDTVEVEVLM